MRATASLGRWLCRRMKAQGKVSIYQLCLSGVDVFLFQLTIGVLIKTPTEWALKITELNDSNLGIGITQHWIVVSAYIDFRTFLLHCGGLSVRHCSRTTRIGIEDRSGDKQSC